MILKAAATRAHGSVVTGSTDVKELLFCSPARQSVHSRASSSLMSARSGWKPSGSGSQRLPSIYFGSKTF